jgi:Xaa-Pro aminopeptidase
LQRKVNCEIIHKLATRFGGESALNLSMAPIAPGWCLRKRLVFTGAGAVQSRAMRYAPISPKLFQENRARVTGKLLSNSLAVLNSNDVLPTNADGTMGFVQNADLFYLTGVDQEESALVLFPGAKDPKQREILFIRESSDLLTVWEGHKLSKAEATEVSGIANVQWMSEFRPVLHRILCECEHVYLNANEHSRAVVEVETRDARFIREIREKYPLHDYRRLAPVLHAARVVKSPAEIALIERACEITAGGFRRVLEMVRPGVREMEIEAEYAHEFIRNGANFAYQPIVASGANSCVLHYLQNDQTVRRGQLLLMDVGACYANYKSDLTRTIPVSGKFNRRQRQIYDAVLRVLRSSVAALKPGAILKDVHRHAQEVLTEELLELGLLKVSEVRKQNQENPACRKYFMHGIGHSLGLDTHDVGDMSKPMLPGWVLTCEPGIYIKDEGIGIRLENDILITHEGNRDLMAGIPIEADEIEELMNARSG